MMKMKANKFFALCLLILLVVPLCLPISGSASTNYIPAQRNVIPSNERTFRPLAYTFVLLDGSDGLFRPDDALTREEAVFAVLPLYVATEDIADTYTSDFSDLTPGTALYDAVAFLERSEYLPNFEDNRVFAANTPMKRGELYRLLGEDDNVQKPDEAVTRGEAAEILCRVLGKTLPEGQKFASFRDVAADHPYADDIALAATAYPVKEITVSVAPEDDVAQCVKDAIKTAEKDVPTRLTVLFSSGTYTLEEPIRINNGAYDAKYLEIILRNAPDADPVLKGSVDLSASLFTQVEGKEYYQYALPESVKDKGDWPEFRNLYLNGQHLNIASSEEYVIEKSLRNTVNLGTSANWSYDNWFYLDPSLFEEVTESTVQPMELCINVEWMNKRFRISQYHGIDPQSGFAQVSVMRTEWDAFLGWDGNKRDFKGWTYWLENHLSLLDEPGEFFYDDQAGIIYFYPYTDTDMQNATISYPLAKNLIKISRASGVTVEGLTFTGTTSTFVNAYGYNGGLGGTYLGNPAPLGDRGHLADAAIYGDYTSIIRVRNCTFHALGGHGIYFDYGCQNTTVQGNSFTDLSMGGIIIGRQYPDWTVKNGLRNLIVDNNYIHNVGIDYPLSPGIQVTRVRSMALTHNTVVHTPYCGIMVGWFMDHNEILTKINNSRQVEVAYNYCEDNVYATNDGSAIYLPGANADIDTEDVLMRCHHNYLKATGYLGTYNGIYLDANSSNWLVEHNVIEGFATNMGPIFNQGCWVPSQMTYNNYLLNNYTTQERVLVKEGGYLGHTVEHDKTVRSRNIVLEGNRYFDSASKIPATAKAIMSAAGQTDAYAHTRATRDTEVVMHTSDAHITLKRNGNPDTAYVTFTITNNENRTVSYKVTNTNADSLRNVAEMVVLSVNGQTGTRVLTLEPGETGDIAISFRGRTIPELEGIAEFAVVKDNGWKMNFRRTLHLTVGREQEENPVPAPDELLDDATDTLPKPVIPEATDTTTTTTPDDKSSGTAPEIVIACVAIPLILIVAVIVIVVSKKKK